MSYMKVELEDVVIHGEKDKVLKFLSKNGTVTEYNAPAKIKLVSNPIPQKRPRLRGYDPNNPHQPQEVDPNLGKPEAVFEDKLRNAWSLVKRSKKKHSQSWERWTPAQDTELLKRVKQDWSTSRIAKRLNRSYGAVWNRRNILQKKENEQ